MNTWEEYDWSQLEVVNVFAGSHAEAAPCLRSFLPFITDGLFLDRPLDDRPSLIDWSRAIDSLAPLYESGIVDWKIACNHWRATSDRLLRRMAKVLTGKMRPPGYHHYN